jgi:hypothetical protein
LDKKIEQQSGWRDDWGDYQKIGKKIEAKSSCFFNAIHSE